MYDPFPAAPALVARSPQQDAARPTDRSHGSAHELPVELVWCEAEGRLIDVLADRSADASRLATEPSPAIPARQSG